MDSHFISKLHDKQRKAERNERTRGKTILRINCRINSIKEGIQMAKKGKKNKGTKYVNQAEFAEEVLVKNDKHPAQNNPRE
ncbi:DUF4023 family protein [Paenibacillus larvae]|nr:DUF4023 family protein [Paenibacillus larvae]MDT2193638.1 DUF4023 family protein [Paenibacillus larvae]MDT2240951.1 DUF4023 family protein [Paenibacillus larvae]MDT2277370.1 DUF4023 family protein [Paenibacillus larvae]